MRFRLITLLLLACTLATRLARAEGFEVLVWNTQQGLSNEIHAHRPLDSNLQWVVTNEKPAIIVLLEHIPGMLNDATYQKMFSEYTPTHVTYNNDSGPIGYGILVRRDLKHEVYLGEILDWMPDGLSKPEREKYYESWAWINPRETVRFSRRYVEVNVTYQGKVYSVVPAHLAMHMISLKKRWGKVLGLPATFLSIVFGWENPLFNQIRNLRRVLTSRFGSEFDRGNLVLIGDMNSPWWSSTYRALKKGLKKMIRGFEATWPTYGSNAGNISLMRIDHGFAGKNVEVVQSAVLPLLGSDHKPIWARIHSSCEEKFE